MEKLTIDGESLVAEILYDEKSVYLLLGQLRKEVSVKLQDFFRGNPNERIEVESLGSIQFWEEGNLHINSLIDENGDNLFLGLILPQKVGVGVYTVEREKDGINNIEVAKKTATDIFNLLNYIDKNWEGLDVD